MLARDWSDSLKLRLIEQTRKKFTKKKKKNISKFACAMKFCKYTKNKFGYKGYIYC